MSISMNLRKTLAAAAVTLLALSFASCADSADAPQSTETGVVQASVALTTGDITSVTYEITGNGITTALTGSLTVAGSAATGTTATGLAFPTL